MKQESIKINVTLDPQNMPEHIDWSATGTETAGAPQAAKAFFASFWDGEEKAAMRIDLWTKRMMVDEMNDFTVQTLLTLADSYARATKNNDLAEELKQFAAAFKKTADEKIKEGNQGKNE